MNALNPPHPTQPNQTKPNQVFHTTCVGQKAIPFQRQEPHWESYVRKHFSSWRCAPCLAREAEMGASPLSPNALRSPPADPTRFQYVGNSRQVLRDNVPQVEAGYTSSSLSPSSSHAGAVARGLAGLSVRVCVWSVWRGVPNEAG